MRSMGARRVAVRDSPSETARCRAGPDLCVTSFPEVVGGRTGGDYARPVHRETGDLGRRTPGLQGIFTLFTCCLHSLFIERRGSGASTLVVSARKEGRAASRQPHRIAAIGSAGARARHTSPAMAILVDELREYPEVALPFTSWCHMATDGRFEDLHAFAARLGLRRAWFQGDHYDLPPHG